MEEWQKFNLPEEEKKILKVWETNKIFEKSLARTKKGRRFVFFEGPPTANGLPGVHHAEARAFKDVMLRYKTMQGFFVPRRAGWDTHGLPVEIEVEKALGLKTKRDIEAYGIAKFNQRAKESVWRYKDEWEKATKRLGFWLDLKRPYVTYETSYIETLWWIIKTVWKKGLLYQDFKVVPWCPRCETGLSSHEVGLGYKKVRENSIYVKLKIKGRKDEYLLVWTTTPWTLPANTAVALNPKIEYTKFRIGDLYMWAANTPPYDVGTGVDVIEKVSGKTLIGVSYEPLYPVKKEYSLGSEPQYKTIAGDFVSTEEGTGMVHLAPAFGEEDMAAAKSQITNHKSQKAGEISYPILHTVNLDGTMKKGVIGEGKFVKEADKTIIADLERRGLLYKVVSYEHDYPFCWRCITPLLYFARTAWWIKMSSLREDLIANNKRVNWIPAHIKDGRFGEFLREVRDWAFSRERYWGTPLPVWRCEKCDAVVVVGSLKELKRLNGGKIPAAVRNQKEEIDLHRPFIDAFTFQCKKCRGLMRRVPEVADVWFDSGAMPFAQAHYPFEKKEFLFPADYIVEGVDQTRGWFYTLLAVATLLGKGAPYKNVISLGHVLDKNGQKMSKSKGNVVDPGEMVKKYGADTLRWYFYTINSPGEPKRFDESDLLTKLRGFLMTFWNCFALFDTYAAKAKSSARKAKSRNVLDQWILVKLDMVVTDVTKKLNAYDITDAARAIEEFTIRDFSQWYLRRSRRRFQRPESQEEKKVATATTAEVLFTLCRLSAPFVPFASEAIYQRLRKRMWLAETSVHHAQWPIPGESRIKNQESKHIVGAMEIVREVVAGALKLRAQAGVKVRQPLQRLQITNGELRKNAELLGLIKDEVNVKEIAFGNKLELDTKITSKLREEGMIREVIRNIQEMRRDLGLKPRHVIRVRFQGSEEVAAPVSRFTVVIKKETNARSVQWGGKKVYKVERELTWEGKSLWVGIGI